MNEKETDLRSTGETSGCDSNARPRPLHFRQFPNFKGKTPAQFNDELANSISRMDASLRQHTESARLHFYKQQAAWWKSKCLATQYENKILKHMLDQIYGQPRQDSSSVRPCKKKNKKKKKIFRPKKSNCCEDSDESMEYEISDEFKQFLDINRQHKEEQERLKAERKKERGSESETEKVERMEQEPTGNQDKLRQQQLKQLYGDSWTLVEGLETHVQMKYDQFCDKHKPVFWPNIPLNL